MRTVFYILWQCIWGLPQTLLGFAVFLLHVGRPHSFYHGAIVTVWKKRSSASMGLFLFIAENAWSSPKRAERLLVHEYGHTVQSLVLGPLFLPVVGLPSFLWAGLPVCQKLRTRKNISYYTFYPEKWADRWGEKVLGIKVT